jgi:hypothetical protein
MATTTFSGPIKAGSVREGASANVGFVLMSQSGNVTFAANGTETVVATVPANSQIFQITVDVTTAFDAGTTNTWLLALKRVYLLHLTYLRSVT